MTSRVDALVALLAPVAPTGVDLDKALETARGLRASDLTREELNALGAALDHLEDLSDDPAEWFGRMSNKDIRYTLWAEMAKALGAAVVLKTETSTGVDDEGDETPSNEEETIEGVDPDAFLGSGGGPPSKGKPNFDLGGGSGDGDDDESEDERRQREEERKRKREERKSRARDTWQDREAERAAAHKAEIAERAARVRASIPAPQPVCTETPQEVAIVIQDPAYIGFRDRVLTVFRELRSGDPMASGRLRTLRSEISSHPGPMDVHWATRLKVQQRLDLMIRALEQRQDLQRPKYFNAVYVVPGSYDD